jgi:hypothetical protein
LLLVSDVGSNHALVQTDGRHEVAASPEVLAGEVPLPTRELPRDVDHTLALDIADHLRDRLLRRNKSATENLQYLRPMI